jgi:hypothetical protein
MASSEQKILQLSSLLSQIGAAYSAPGSPVNRAATGLTASAQSGILAAQREEAKKLAEKKKKGALGGSIGGTLGALAGIALAPVTGGASLALVGAASGALGSAAGSLATGGEIDTTSVLTSAAMGGIGGGFAGHAAKAAGTAGQAAATIPGGALNSAMVVPGVASQGAALQGGIQAASKVGFMGAAKGIAQGSMFSSLAGGGLAPYSPTLQQQGMGYNGFGGMGPGVVNQDQRTQRNIYTMRQFGGF